MSAPLTPEQRETLEKLRDTHREGVAFFRAKPGAMQQEMAGRNQAAADALDAAIAALADCDDRRRAAQQATWRRAAHVVDYYTGRDLDLMDEEYTKETAR